VSGYNIISRPRQEERVSFQTLRDLADSYDMMRLIIETRKDQVDHINMIFRPKKDRQVSLARIKAVEDFFLSPDQEHDFRTWLRMLLEDLLVIDAPTLWKQRDRGGRLIALHPLDGGTIKRVIDDWGRTPRPYYDESGNLVRMPAYQQVLKGYPAIDYMADDLIYAPRNPRTNRVYGFSPVEQVIMTVQIAMRRQLNTLQYFTEGNIPEALIGVPDGWTPDQIKQFQDYWDLYFTGDLAARRHAKFVPGGVAKTFIQTKEPELKSVFDEWLAKIICYAFSVSPQWATAQVNRATATVAKEQAEEEGLVPILNWITRLLTRIVVSDLGEPDIECTISDDEQIDPATESTIVSSLIAGAIITRNQGLVRLGMEESDEPEADMLGFTTAAGFVPLSQEEKDKIADEQMKRQISMAPPPPPPGEGQPPGDSSSSAKDDGNAADKPADKPAADKKIPARDGAEAADKVAKREDGDVRDVHVHVNIPSLLEKDGHDVSSEARDDRGRFTSSGGPTSRERRKAENAARRKDDEVARDNTGRFASGKLTRKQIQKTADKVRNNLIAGAVLAGSAKVVSHLASKAAAGGHVNTWGNGTASVLAGLALFTVEESAKSVLYTVIRAAGGDSDFAKKGASLINTNVKQAFKLLGLLGGGDGKSGGSSDNSEGDAVKLELLGDLHKSDDTEDTEDDPDQDVARIADTVLPTYMPDIIDGIFDHLSTDVPEEDRDRFEEVREYAHELSEKTIEEISKLGKSFGE
jgi:hypothetical protein